MGTRGPVPERSDNLSRDRDANRGGRPDVTKGVMRPVDIPDADPEWHPIAKMLWESLEQSGQSDFYQQTDWAFAYSLCEDLSMYKKPFTSATGVEYHKRSGQMLATIYSAMSNLLVTEADRRRVRIELEEPDDESTSAAVLAIADYKQMLEDAE